tara:strand:- start:454 stop:699 length:246 start_codon:yes stop_codon:yes gene_type:complete
MAWAKIIRKRPQGRAADVDGVIRYTGEIAEFPDQILEIRPTWFELVEPPKKAAPAPKPKKATPAPKAKKTTKRKTTKRKAD